MRYELHWATRATVNLQSAWMGGDPCDGTGSARASYMYWPPFRQSFGNYTYCDLRGWIKGAALNLYPVYVERANMANIVWTIYWPYWHTGVRYLEYRYLNH